jgi:hypothetical protein
MGGWAEEVYYSMLKSAESLEHLNAPWPEVQDAYLRAWEFRPTRAEALFAIALRYRVETRYQLGYLFAERAAKIPLPEGETLFVNTVIHSWRALDEQAICAFWIGEHAEAFRLCRTLLAQCGIPEQDRQRIVLNRDFSVPAMIDAASLYPEPLAQRPVVGSRDFGVTVTLVAGPDRAATERTLNSFLNCCVDVSRVGRFLVIPADMSTEDDAALLDRYRFLELSRSRPGVQLAQIRNQIDTRYWLHLGIGWLFFAPDNYITRLTAVLEAEPGVFQVGINFDDAMELSGVCAAEDVVRRKPDTGGYVLTDSVSSGPAMFDTGRLDLAGVVDSVGPGPFGEFGRQPPGAGMRTATLDEVLCVVDAGG